MRLAAAVVVGMLLVSSGRIVRAEEGTPAEPASGGSNRLSRFLCKWNPLCQPPGRPQTCSDACDAGYDTCMTGWDGRRSTSCAASAVRCKRDCPPEAATSHTIHRTPANCMDLCSIEFGDCTKRPQDPRKPDECATETVKCRNACKEMQLAAAPAPAAPPVAAAPAAAEERVAAGAPAPASERAAEPAPAAVENPVERHEPVLSRAMAKDPKTAPARPPAPAPAPAPPPAPPAVVTDTTERAESREPPPAPAPPAPAVPIDATGTTGVAPSAAVAASGAATATKAERPGFFARMRCYLTPSCRGGSAPTAPRTCVEQCQADYDRCVGPGENLPGSECATWMMRCRQKCRQDSAAKAP